MDNKEVIKKRNKKGNIAAIIFIAKLVVLYFLFVGVNKFAYSALTPTGKFYNFYFSSYLNYIQGLRTSLIVPAAYLIRAFGFDTYYNNTDIMVLNGTILRVNYDCLGLNVFSFLTAFTLAFPSQLRSKIKLFTVGIFTVYLLNIIRIAGLAILLSTFPAQQANFSYHHEVFNIVVYAVIFTLLYFWIKRNPPLADNSG
jgi:exosortase/archaeosortase family protein